MDTVVYAAIKLPRRQQFNNRLFVQSIYYDSRLLLRVSSKKKSLYLSKARDLVFILTISYYLIMLYAQRQMCQRQFSCSTISGRIMTIRSVYEQSSEHRTAPGPLLVYTQKRPTKKQPKREREFCVCVCYNVYRDLLGAPAHQHIEPPKK